MNLGNDPTVCDSDSTFLDEYATCLACVKDYPSVEISGHLDGLGPQYEEYCKSLDKDVPTAITSTVVFTVNNTPGTVPITTTFAAIGSTSTTPSTTPSSTSSLSSISSSTSPSISSATSTGTSPSMLIQLPIAPCSQRLTTSRSINRNITRNNNPHSLSTTRNKPSRNHRRSRRRNSRGVHPSFSDRLLVVSAAETTTRSTITIGIAA
ncbi:hypothetical protein F5Y18DRAFT_377153 [Xylariaceae sp. FL1019]|nr:hypothetical protein F5Y18DRAFT_377153 [Xylariaceae sp. FL1019]